MRKNVLLGRIKEKQMTLGKVADAIGISLSTLRRKIAGTTEFTREEINGICRLLDICNEDLLYIFFND